MQQLADIEKSDSKEKISRLQWTIQNDRRNVTLNINTETDNLKNVLYRYRNKLYFIDETIDLNLTENQSLLAK